MTTFVSRFAAGVALTSLILVSGCGKGKPASSTTDAPKKELAAPVVGKAEKKSLRRVLEEPATVTAIEETPLFARLTGYLAKVNVDIGDKVKGPQEPSDDRKAEPGQVLAELKVPEQFEELRQKTQLVKQADAEVEQADAAWKAAQAHEETAAAMVTEAEAARARVQANYARWESEFKRVSGLVERGVIDAQSRDETENQFKSAGASRQEVEARVLSAKAMEKESKAKSNKAKADLDAARAKVEVAKAEEGRVRAMTGYAKIHAPYDGVITKRNFHTGYRLTADSATPLLVIARMDVVRVVVEVPETDAGLVDEGTEARVRFQAIKDEEFKMKVKRVSWGYDQKARTLRAEIELPNPKGRFRPGTYAYVSFDTNLPAEYTLPVGAVVTAGGESFCYREEDGKAVRTPIKVGFGDGKFVQVLQKQVKDGELTRWVPLNGEEKIVVANVGSVSDGKPIAGGEK